MRITFGKLVSTKLSINLLKPALGLAAIAAIASACGPSTSTNPGTGGSTAGTAGATGTAGNGDGGTATGGNSSGGTTGSAGSNGGSSAGNTGSAGNGTAGSTGGSVGAGGNSTGGSAAGTAGSSGGNVGTGGNATGGSSQGGRGGSAGGTGGSSAGSGGSGGSSAGGTSGGSGGTTGTGGTGGGASACTCPTNATFCSDFEANALPSGAVYKVNAAPGDWSRDFAVDSAQHKCGNSSLRVKSGSNETGTSGSAYQMLAVTAPTSAFWVRFFVRSDIDMGGMHNAFAKASESDDPNSSVNIEFAEDVGIAFNTNDSDVWPTGYGRLTNGSTNPYVLPANAWYCVEISYDSSSRVQQLYVNGTQLINATNYPATALSAQIKIFKFGFQNFHGPARTMWFDSVAVAPTRIAGCN